jgi:AraC-like DNA-binding protein
MIACNNIAEIGALNHAMYEDFIQRVHKYRNNPNMSSHIQACVDYIERHVEDPISLKLLSEHSGYSEYHLSRKFHQEMGITLNQYIQNVRIEQAKKYLIQFDEPISQIAYRLQFSSSSHFSSVFYKSTEKKPLEYRNQFRKY